MCGERYQFRLVTSYWGLHAPPLREECHASSFLVWSLDVREVIGLPRVTWGDAGMKSVGEKDVFWFRFSEGFYPWGGAWGALAGWLMRERLDRLCSWLGK